MPPADPPDPSDPALPTLSQTHLTGIKKGLAHSPLTEMVRCAAQPRIDTGARRPNSTPSADGGSARVKAHIMRASKVWGVGRGAGVGGVRGAGHRMCAAVHVIMGTDHEGSQGPWGF
jgi:hypothetical protein